MKIHRPLSVLFLLLAATGPLPGCASPGPSPPRNLRPGQTVEFDGRDYQLQQVEEDFVLLGYRDAGAEKGAISGFVDEVFRIPRYELGKGRWYANEKLPGVYLQWLGLDSFALAHDRSAVGDAPIVMIP